MWGQSVAAEPLFLQHMLSCKAHFYQLIDIIFIYTPFHHLAGFYVLSEAASLGSTCQINPAFQGP